MTDSSPKICILGGGFGGLYTALRLSQLPCADQHPPQITLIDKSDRFLFSPLLTN
jgi:NADH dehydrogenase